MTLLNDLVFCDLQDEEAEGVLAEEDRDVRADEREEGEDEEGEEGDRLMPPGPPPGMPPGEHKKAFLGL